VSSEQPGPNWGPPQPPQHPQHPPAAYWGAPPPPPRKKKPVVPILIGVGAFVVVIGIIGAVAAAGSSDDKKHGTVSDSPGTNVQSTAAPTAKNSAPTAKPSPAKAATAAFGQTYRWADGLAANVSRIRQYTPSEYAAGTHKGDTAVIVTVKITNGSGKPFDTALLSVNVKAGPDGVAGEQIFDSDKGLGDGFSGTIVPGSAATADFAFDIPKGTTGALDVEIQPDMGMDYASEHWVGKLP
jgi:hypothetical protein